MTQYLLCFECSELTAAPPVLKNRSVGMKEAENGAAETPGFSYVSLKSDHSKMEPLSSVMNVDLLRYTKKT